MMHLELFQKEDIFKVTDCIEPFTDKYKSNMSEIVGNGFELTAYVGDEVWACGGITIVDKGQGVERSRGRR